MLDSALEIIHTGGLTVSLDHISLEDVIRRADVARSAAYRQWPYKDLFLSDLLRELADTEVSAVREEGDHDALVGLLGEAFRSHSYALESEQGRLDLALDLLRQGAQADFAGLLASPGWRTYLALHATFLSLADGDLREEVGNSLARSDRRIVEQLAANYERVADLLGYRLRADRDVGYATIATLATANFRGLILMALATPEIADQRLSARISSKSADWSLVGLGVAALAAEFLEVDPSVVWDEERIDSVRSALEDEGWTS